MKKTIIAFGVSLLAVSAQAQLTQNWFIPADATAITSFANDSNTRGLGYNRITDNVYLVSRTGALNIQVRKAADGTVGSPSTLNVTGIAGGTFALNDVDVTDEGVIYGANLANGNGTTPVTLNVYRWANEAAAPVLVYTASASERLGDTFAVRGIDSNNSTEIFIGGQGNANVRRLVTADNGATFTVAATNGTIASGQASTTGGLHPRRENSNLIITTGGLSKREVLLDGTLVETADTGIVGSSFGPGDLYYNTDGDIYLALQVGNASPQLARVFDITTGLGVGEIATIFNTPSMGTNSNGNGTGDIVFTNAGNMIVLSTANGLGSYGSSVDFGTNANAFVPPVASAENWELY